MSYFVRTCRYKNGKSTKSFRGIHPGHINGCAMGESEKNGEEWWFSGPSCTCGDKWKYEEEIRLHKREIKKHKKSIRILKTLVKDYEDLG